MIYNYSIITIIINYFIIILFMMHWAFHLCSERNIRIYTEKNEREQYIKETRNETLLHSFYTHDKMQEELIALIGHK